MSGQRAQAALTIPELVKRTPLPKGGVTMLDLGGGHGLFADAMCQKHPRLQATVFDLPGALDASDHAGLSNRVRFVRGDVLNVDLETDRYDLVFAGNLLHHFEESQIQGVIRRAATSLTSGGILTVADFLKFDTSKSPGQIPALLDFYFAVTSGGGALSLGRLKGWMRECGLNRVRVVKLRSVPGMGLVIGTAD